MNKKLLAMAILLFGAFTAQAQYPLKTIQEVQTVSQQDLAAGIEASSIPSTDTIRIRGVVIMDAGLSTLVGGKQIWIQTNDGSSFSGIDLYQNFPGSTVTGDAGTGILSLVAGDSVEITGNVLEYQGETEFVPVNTTPATPIQILGGGITVKSKLITAAELNDANRNNILTTGEQYEGMFVEIRNLTVSTVDYFSNGTRVSFNIVDAAGNKINVSDRFKAFKLPAAGGTFVPPNVGDVLTSIKGIIAHSLNNRGYEMHVFDASQIVYGAAAPTISQITRSIKVPTSTDAITVTANITDKDGVNSADLYYAVGVNSTSYTAVAMTANGNSYSAVIPAQADGSFVKYYISAKDNSTGQLVSRIPNVPTEDPKFYVVRNAGMGIYDVQYTPFKSGNSGFLGQEVTVSGIVTASANDLGYVFIQQENQLNWAGLMCIGSTTLSTLAIGDKVTVTGTVRENFGFTRIEAITSVAKNGTGTIAPIVLVADSFRKYSFTGTEPYEGMLVKFVGNSGSTLKVVNSNADDPSNFAEYRVGPDTTDAGAGCRVIAGRVTSSVYSSLNVSYVTDTIWATISGVMKVAPIVVQKGDAMTSVTGIMDYSFSNCKLMPRNNADFENYVRLNVGVNSNAINLGKVVAYPNPTSNQINFDYILPANAANCAIIVYDLLGKEVANTNINTLSGSVSMATTNLAQGTYLYSITSSNLGQLNNGRFVVVK
jgi:predicted extracellular nuclease